MPRHKQSDPSIIKSSVIRLRVTEAEADLFRTKAAEAGCKSISEYIRMRCISEDSNSSDSGVDIEAKTKKNTLATWRNAPCGNQEESNLI